MSKREKYPVGTTIRSEHVHPLGAFLGGISVGVAIYHIIVLVF